MLTGANNIKKCRTDPDSHFNIIDVNLKLGHLLGSRTLVNAHTNFSLNYYARNNNIIFAPLFNCELIRDDVGALKPNRIFDSSIINPVVLSDMNIQLFCDENF